MMLVMENKQHMSKSTRSRRCTRCRLLIHPRFDVEASPAVCLVCRQQTAGDVENRGVTWLLGMRQRQAARETACKRIEAAGGLPKGSYDGVEQRVEVATLRRLRAMPRERDVMLEWGADPDRARLWDGLEACSAAEAEKWFELARCAEDGVPLATSRRTMEELVLIVEAEARAAERLAAAGS